MDVGLEKTITLLPIKIEIRKVRKVTLRGRTSLNLEEKRQRDGILGGLANSGAALLRLQQISHDYWIRWYPDEIQFKNPVGRITQDEILAWNAPENETLRNMQNLIGEADLGTPGVKDAWIQFCKKIGSPARAFLVMRHFKNGEEWDFDKEEENNIKLFPISDLIQRQGISKGVIEELKRGFKNNGKATSGRYEFVGGERWAFRDAGNKNQFRIQAEGGRLWVYEQLTQPAGLFFHRGTRAPVFPDMLNVYALNKDSDGRYIPQPIYENIPVQKDRIAVSFDNDNRQLQAWVVDFDEAVHIGMGIKINDPEKVKLIDAADWLILFGYEDGKTEDLEGILKRDNALGSLSFVPQDTPTNNSDETTSPFIPREFDAVKFIKACRPLPATPNPDPDKTNRKKLSKALGIIDESVFADIPFCDDMEGDYAEQMATLLWDSSTYVYFQGSKAGQTIRQSADIGQIKNFFCKYVKGRGPLPVLRVGRNPYGILPVVSTRFISPTDSILQMAGVINDLKTDFLNLAELLPVVGERSDDFDRLTEILKTTSVASTFNVRGWPFLTKDNFPAMLDCPLVSDQGNLDYLENDLVAKLTYPLDNTAPALLRILHNYIRSIKTIEDTNIAIEFMRNPARRLKQLGSEEKLNVLFAETMDLFSHRLDAWVTGIAEYLMQNKTTRGPVGVFGWLEKPGEIDESERIESEYIQAPSEGQVNTLTVLRNAALSAGTDERKRPFNVNLSSEQVKRGIDYLDAVRQGHLPGEVLGYMLERMIHDNRKIGDSKIYELRKKYSIAVQMADEFGSEAVHISNVIDAERFIDDRSTNGGELGKIKKVLQKTKDAAADIALAEATYGIMRGKTDAASGWMDFLDGAINPPPNEFVSTQRTGKNRVSKIFLFLDYPPRIENTYVNTAPIAPRAIAEPVLANFCEGLLEGFSEAALSIQMTGNKNPGGSYTQTVTMEEIGFSAFDLVIQGKEFLETVLKYRGLDIWLSNLDDCQNILGIPTDRQNIEEYVEELNIKIIGKDDPGFQTFLAAADRIRKIFQRNRQDGKGSSDKNELSIFEKVIEIDPGRTKEVLQNRINILREKLDGLRNGIRGIMASSGMDDARDLWTKSNIAGDGLGTLMDLADANKQTEYKKTVFIRDLKTYVEGMPPTEDLTQELLGNLYKDFETWKKRWEEIKSGCEWNDSCAENSILAKVNGIRQELSAIQAELATMANSGDYSNYGDFLNELKPALEGLVPVNVCEGNGNLKKLFSEVINPNLNILIEGVEGELSAEIGSNMEALNQSLFEGNDLDAMKNSADLLKKSIQTAKEKCTSAIIQSGILLSRGCLDFPGAAKFGIHEALLPVVAPWTAAQAVGLYERAGAVARKIDAKIDVIDNGQGDPVNVLQETTGDKAALTVLEPVFQPATNGVTPPWDLQGGLNLAQSGGGLGLPEFKIVRPGLADFMDLISTPEFALYCDPFTGENASGNRGRNDCYYAVKSGCTSAPDGLVFVKVDEWQEFLPDAEQTTGIGIKYNGPRAEAPNLILIAVSPIWLFPRQKSELGNITTIDPWPNFPVGLANISLIWTNQILAETIAETIELMKIRMITSEEMLASDLLWRILPATTFEPDQNGNLLFPTRPMLWMSAWPFLDQFRNKNALNPAQISSLGINPKGSR